MGRNTPILKEIVEIISPQLYLKEHAFYVLEAHFHDRLLMDVGNVTTVASAATQLRLNITQQECSLVLDYVAEQKVAVVTLDHVEQVVWDLFGNRFIEP